MRCGCARSGRRRPPSALTPILEIQGLSKSYGAIPALRDVSFEVRRGEFLCIIGPSGCGKTTLLRMIAGFIPPSSGEILLDGTSVLGQPPHRRPVNMVFQNYALFPHMTVGQNVAFGMEMHKVDRDERRERVRKVLERVELAGFESRGVDALSGGQQQRVALARALVLNPRVLLLDEPLGALDQKVRRRMQVELKRIHRDVGITFIHVTHDQEEALAMADRIAVMADGRIEQLADTLEVYVKPQTPFVAGFVGESNRFAGTVVADGARNLALPIGDGPVMPLPPVAGLAAGTPVQVFVRPEHVRIAETDGQGMALFDGTVRDIVFLGESARCYIDLANGPEIVAASSADAVTRGAIPPVGTRVRVGWRTEAAMVFPAGAA
jgi:spermidine/putrescine ABC transporter ATP-binding subunit